MIFLISKIPFDALSPIGTMFRQTDDITKKEDFLPRTRHCVTDGGKEGTGWREKCGGGEVEVKLLQPLYEV